MTTLPKWMKYLPFAFVEWYAKTQCDSIYLHKDKLLVSIVFSDSYLAYQMDSDCDEEC